MGDINRSRFLPVIERILDEFDQPGQVITIDRIDLELGTIPLECLDLAIERLEAALREALIGALNNGVSVPTPHSNTGRVGASSIEALPVRAALLHRLTQYLLYGTWPYQDASANDPRALLADLLANEPTVLLILIGHHWKRPAFIRRLALQLPSGDLDRLLGMIEPDVSDAILATMGGNSAHADLQPTHDIPGSESAGTSTLDRLDAFLVHGTLADIHPEQLLLEAAADDPDGLSDLLHRHMRDDAMLRRMIEVISPDALAKLLALLAPEDAAIIIALMHQVRRLNHTAPVIPLNDRAFERLLWFISLRYVLNEAGTQFNRKRFVERMIAGIANAERLTYRDLLRAFHLGVVELAKSSPNAASLPAIIDDLTRATPTTAALSDPLPEIEQAVEQEHQTPISVMTWMLRSAGASDPAGLRVLLRGLAIRDPALLVRTVGAALPLPTLIKLLLSQEHARHADALTRWLAHATAGGAALSHKIQAAVIGAIAAFDRTGRDRLLPSIFHAVAALSDEAPEIIAAMVAAWPEIVEPDERIASERRVAPTVPARTEPGGNVDHTSEADTASLAGYSDIDRLRHLLMTGVLPWRDMLTEPGLTSDRVIESLERWRPGAVRAALKGTPLTRSHVHSALDTMPVATALALIRLLLPRHPGGQELMQSVTAYTAQAADQRSFRTTLLVALVEGHTLDFEALARAGKDAATNASPHLTQTLLAVLARGVTGASGIDGDRQWFETLERLAVSNMRAARRFMASVARSAAALERLADMCAPPLLDRIFVALVPDAATTLGALANALIAEGRHHGIHRRDITAAFLAEIATIAADAVPALGLIMRLLRKVFGEQLPPWLEPMVHHDLLPHLPHELGRRLAVILAAGQSDKSIPQVRELAARPNEQPAIAVDAASPEGAPGQHTEWLFRTLADIDLSRAAAREEMPELLHELMSELLETPSRDLAIRLVTFLSQARNSTQLIELLPELMLARLITLAAPDVGAGLLIAGEVLAAAADTTGHVMLRSALWQTLLDTVGAPVGERTVAAMSEHFFAIAGRAASDLDQARREAASAALLHAAAQHGRDAGQAALVAMIEQRRGNLIAAYRGSRHPAGGPATALRGPSPRQIRTLTLFRMGDEAVPREPIYVANAGLILANPFLPHLFDTLDWLVRDAAGKPHLRDEATASRAVHLLQYLVDGHTGRPEPRLALNKVLCGMSIAVPVARAIDPTEIERQTCDTLLRSIIENWPILRNTSIAGLRETFLQREGKLTYADVGWRLQVQRKTLDVLVDQVPWSIGVVFHPWMPTALHVTW
jgi:hypothetical protein